MCNIANRYPMHHINPSDNLVILLHILDFSNNSKKYIYNTWINFYFTESGAVFFLNLK